MLLILIHVAPAHAETATLVLRNGKIATADRAFTIQESVAILDNRIIYVGNDYGVQQFIGDDTRVVELDGRFTMPGMTDAHCHPFNLGRIDDEERFSVAGTTSFEEVVEKVER